jgi:hypothetical protein
VIVDLGSTTGTLVNGSPINGPTVLKPLDKVQLGGTVFEIQLPAPPPAQAAAPPVHAQAQYRGPAPLPGCVFVAYGRGCALELYDDKVRITREGGLSNLLIHGLRGDKEILLRSVTAIQFKPAGTLTVGYIQFTFGGGQETKKALFDAVSDENTVIFLPDQQPAFERIKMLIEEKTRQQHSPQQVAAYSPADELTKLGNLLQQGLITREEFESAKRKLGF